MTCGGYIILARNTYKISKTWKALTPIQKTIMLTLMMMANHQDGQWWDDWKKEWVQVKRGQLITSLENIKKACGKGVSIQNIRTALLNLENMQFLTNQSTKHYRLITLLKYDFYQSQENYSTKKPTNGQQRSNKGLTTNKHGKHGKQLYMDYVYLTQEEHDKLVEQFGERKTQEYIERVNYYVGSTGKNYKSHYLTILNWERKDRNKELQKQPRKKEIII